MLQTVPYSEEIEKALIVGLLSDPSIIPRITTELEEEDFFRDQHREIYKVIKSLEIDKVDSLTVQDSLSLSTKDYFSELVKNSDSILPSLTNVRIYAQTIKDKSKLRAGINLGREITATCFEPNIPADDVLQKLEDMFAKFLQNRITKDHNVSTQKAFEEFLSDLKFKREEVGVRTGFQSIDSLLGDLEGLVVLAARPSVGKSSLAFQIARNVSETRNVLLFSLEQPQSQIFERLLSVESKVRLEEIKSGTYLSNTESTQRIQEASDKLKGILKNIYIDDTAFVSSSYISSVSRQKQLQFGHIGLIIVDYLHIMKLAEGNKVDTLEAACSELRALGKELRCPVMLLSQLSRQSDTYQDGEGHRKQRRPELTDLRSSGGIEAVCDQALFLYKESIFGVITQPNDDIVEVLIRKNRNGSVGGTTLRWEPRFVKFSDLT